MNEVDRAKAAKALVAEMYDSLDPDTLDKDHAVMFKLAQGWIREKEENVERRYEGSWK